VKFPRKLEPVINLNTAKALGLCRPPPRPPVLPIGNLQAHRNGSQKAGRAAAAVASAETMAG